MAGSFADFLHRSNVVFRTSHAMLPPPSSTHAPQKKLKQMSDDPNKRNVQFPAPPGLASVFQGGQDDVEEQVAGKEGGGDVCNGKLNETALQSYDNGVGDGVSLGDVQLVAREEESSCDVGTLGDAGRSVENEQV